MSVRMVIVENPFDRSKCDIKNVDFNGESLGQLKAKYIPKDLNVVVSVNGGVVEKQFLDSRIPRTGDEIVFMPVIGGGGGGDKDILGAVLMIALVVAAPYIAGTVLGLEAGTLAYNIALVTTVAAGGMLINSLMPQPQTPRLDFDAEGSQLYRWNPKTVQRQGTVVPKIYGEIKLYGNVISVYTEPDSGDDTKQLLNMLIALGSGPVEGITKKDGSNFDIRINGQQIQNYEEVDIEEKKGTLEQTVISLFDDTKPEYRPNRVVTNTGGSEIYTTPDNDFDDLEIELLFDRGIYFANNSGGLSNHSIDIKIEISEHDAASWNILVDDTVTDNQTSPKRISYTASGTYTGGSAVTINQGTKYDIRVSKDTSDQASSRYGDRMLIGSIREVLKDGFKYPGRALLAIKALATEQLSGAMEVDVIQQGSIVAVYNGSWTLEYSNNPAWVLYDILSQPVISGDGGGTPYDVAKYEGINPNRLDLPSFVALAVFCDEEVPSGIGGGVEKRITFNGGFDVGTTMWEAALKVCEIARCTILTDGTTTKVVIDKTDTPKQMFNVSNIIKDSFKRTILPKIERASEIEIQYIDALQDFKRSPFTIINSDAGNLENKVTLELFGVTSQSEAYRAGLFRLAQNLLLKSTIEFEADIDAIHSKVGNVIWVQHDVPDWKDGGRVISSTNNTVTVDREVTESGGTDRILVRIYNPGTGDEEIEDHLVSGVVGQVITIADIWTVNPSKTDVFCYGTSDEPAKKYRITEFSKGSEQLIRISAIEYNEDIYEFDSDTPIRPISDYDSPGSDADSTRPPSFDEFRREYPKSLIGFPTMNVPMTQNLAWSGNSVDTVSWAKEVGPEDILLIYEGISYVIAADSTTDTYIYWDKNSNNNTFKTTNTLDNTIGTDKWLMCYNQDGVEYPAWAKKVIHGGLIQADTITTSQILITGKIGDAVASKDSSLLPNWRLDIEDSNGRPAGIYPVEGITDFSQVDWIDGNKDSIKILSTDDATVAYGFPAMPIDDKQKYTIVIRHKSSVTSDSGLYLRLNGYNAALPVGKTHIGNSGGSNTQDRTGTVGLVSNVPMPGTSWVVNSYTYTPTAGTKYASFSMYNWNPDTAGVEYHVDYVLMYLIPKDADQIAESASNKWAGESGADVTGNNQGDVYLANVSGDIDDISDGSTYARMLAVWKHSSDTTLIDGGKIFANSITVNQMAANSITAANAAIADLTVDTLQIKGVAVTTEKVDDDATTLSAFSNTAASVLLTSGTTTIVQTISDFVSIGGTVALTGSVYPTQSGASQGRMKLHLYRDATLIASSRWILGGVEGDSTSTPGHENSDFSISIQDAPGSGTYDYYLKVEVDGGYAVYVEKRKLFVEETKK